LFLALLFTFFALGSRIGGRLFGGDIQDGEDAIVVGYGVSVSIVFRELDQEHLLRLLVCWFGFH